MKSQRGYEDECVDVALEKAVKQTQSNSITCVQLSWFWGVCFLGFASCARSIPLGSYNLVHLIKMSSVW